MTFPYLGVALEEGNFQSSKKAGLSKFETLRYEVQNNILVIKSITHSELYGTDEAVGALLDEPQQKFKGFELKKTSRKYFNDLAGVEPICRAVLIADIIVNGGINTILTSAYNILEDGGKFITHTQVGEKGSQCHAEMFCITRLDDLLTKLKKTVTIEQLKGGIRIKGSKGLATTACPACVKVRDNFCLDYKEIKPSLVFI